MCGRYTSTDPARLRAAFPRFRFGEAAAGALPRYNIAPSQPVLAVRNDGSDNVEAMRWGILRPAGASGPPLINARAESLAEKPAFRDALRTRRCILFADGFYEWRGRQPVRFALQDDRPFAFAGLWEPGPDGTARCVIVTCEASALVRPVHGRMPVILAADAVGPWLAPGELSAPPITLLRPYEAAALRAREASSRLNDPRYDAPDALERADPVQTTLGF